MVRDQQQAVLEFTKRYTKRHGYAPSLHEIRKALKVASVSTAHFHVTKLRNQGYLNKSDHKPRSLALAKPEKVVRIPISGTIAAGSPIEAIEIPDQFVNIASSELSTSAPHYALRVQGDSMVEDGIFSGDVVVIRKQETAEDGQTVVAIIDDEHATLKKLYREKGRYRLQPANQAMLPLYRKEIEVRGVVVKIIRNLESGERSTSSLAERKKIFLNKIKGTNTSTNKYKRVALSTIRYAGGKSLAVGHVVELLPDTIKKVVSPFFGGGSIEIALSKELGLEVVGYDIFDILCNYWDFQIKQPELLYSKLKALKPDKKTFEKIRLILNEVWKKKVKLDPLTLAVYYVYNFNLSYGPGFMGWSSDIYLQKDKYERMLERIRTFAPGKLEVRQGDFRDIIKKHPNDFLYCDPPYYLGSDSKMFRGIYPMRNIPVHHNGFKHEELRDLLKAHKGGFILSYNDCPTIREYYKGYKTTSPTWQYSMGQGETRIGKNRIQNGDDHIKHSHELIIYSPPKI